MCILSHVIMIVPLSTNAEEGEIVSAVATAAASVNAGSPATLPKVKLLRSASLANWMSKE